MILIGCAVIEELEPLLEDSSFQSVDGGLYRHRRLPVIAAPLGVGQMEFLLGFCRVARRFPLTGAIHTGTCGVYPRAAARFPVGTVVSPGVVGLGDGLAAAGRGYIPVPVAMRLTLAAGPWTAPEVSAADSCLTLTAITADDGCARQLEAAYGAVLEQMECYGFALACREAEIPGAALFGVSNVVGCRSHEEWRANRRQAVAATGGVLRDLLPSLSAWAAAWR
jgi:nucleoside phosphorylase